MTSSDGSQVGAIDGSSDSAGDVRFTFSWYERFLRSIDAEGFEFRRYRDASEPGTALLRHDVDLSPQRALRTARIERDLGVEATYFFLVSSPMYNVLDEETRDVLTAIEEMGHDVGLHFSTHQYWSPEDLPEDHRIAARVADERNVLSTVADPIETVSFHIPPDGVLRRAFESFPSTYEPRFFTDIGYRGDSGQRWRDEPPRVEAFDERMQILTHPGLWGESDASFEQRVRQGVDGTAERTGDYARERYIVQRYG